MEILDLISYISILLSSIYLFVVLSFIIGWAKIKYYNAKQLNLSTTVSVIIAARNEEKLIARTIEAILAQNFNHQLLEVIIVDDHSTDRTAAIVAAYANKGVKLISLKEKDNLNSYKKLAIEKAINLAKGELIVTTDADCCMKEDWLSTIVNYYETSGCIMISSPVTYFEEQSLFERLQTLEFSYLIGFGASTIGNNIPSTCNGANLAYQKSAFYEVGGFKGINDLASGDDELLLHKMANKYEGKIGFLKNRSAIVYTHAKPNLKEFIQQRKRWASKSTKYKDKVVTSLGAIIWLFNLSLVLNFILLIVLRDSTIGYCLLAQILIKIGLELIFLYQITNFLKRKWLLLLLPVLSPFHIIYFVYIGVAGNSGKYDWKGRKVN